MTLKDFVSELKQPTIVCICGSQRTGAFNKMLLDSAAKSLAAQGAIVQMVDLEKLDLPMYNPDFEKANNFPAKAVEFKAQLKACDGMVITCPEYNGHITPVLLNAITWATRGADGQYDGFKGKCVSVMATSPGPMGGMRMVRSLQKFLNDMGAVVIAGHCSIGGASKAFAENGTLVDERAKSKVESACGQLVHFARFEANRAADCKIMRELRRLKCTGEYGSVD